MKIQQFEDKGLSHYSYAILSECERKIVLIDPARNISEYLDYAQMHQATITGVIETHPHADFVSGHLELHETTGATIYCSKLLGATYPHQSFDEGDILEIGKIKLKALNTPGHSPDSISILLEHDGIDKAIFTGDTLFIGDCGRPDLREDAGNLDVKREVLAKQMYHSLHKKLLQLNNEILVYPAHGAGTLCGKALSQANSSTIGAEKISNWSLQEMNEEQFVKELIKDQPFIPKYFSYNVSLNKKGAEKLSTAIARFDKHTTISNAQETDRLNKNIVIIDTRPSTLFNDSHLPNAINLMNGGKFETWLGSIITPGEEFYLAAENDEQLAELINKAAKIGYEGFIKEAFIIKYGNLHYDPLNLNNFKNKPAAFTIVDVRNLDETKAGLVFPNAINIPLSELRERIQEIPLENKPIVVHCAGGYRSAAARSIIQNTNTTHATAYDLGTAINEFL